MNSRAQKGVNLGVNPGANPSGVHGVHDACPTLGPQKSVEPTKLYLAQHFPIIQRF